MATTKPDEAVLTALPVLDGEDPWTAEEVAAVRAELIEERDRLRAAVAHAQAELAELMTEVGWRDVQWKNLTGGIVAMHRGWVK